MCCYDPRDLVSCNTITELWRRESMIQFIELVMIFTSVTDTLNTTLEEDCIGIFRLG